ncbi:SIMPL domain-containing protein [uncultured Clostridium sp.]|uniref:SIMPL domain-containing protein n=1 Tax=uncultured Clostridium sp. TaxID=59620 RepID=UPI0028EA0A9D|nr:SIMPL domain-containing protein [uncultured Clostridium sp.]
MYELKYYYNYNLDDDYKPEVMNRFKVFGEGNISVRPDMAEVIVGVITENVQLEAAQMENARITTQVIKSLIDASVEQKNIQTSSYNIRPNYDYINGKQVFRDYEVSNSLKIIITDISSVGEIIDTAVKNGANTVSGVTFRVLDNRKYYYQALTKAIVDAKNKAVIMADKLNVKLNITPIQIKEQLKGGDIVPFQAMTFKASSEATPIEIGENKITAEIEAVFVYE